VQRYEEVKKWMEKLDELRDTDQESMEGDVLWRMEELELLSK
jgi:hypothetical protein